MDYYKSGTIAVAKLDDVMKYAPNIARRLKYSGMREGARNLEEMEKMFAKIPSSYRVGDGLEKTLETIDIWLSTRHGSHIKSYKNGGTGYPSNIIFESNIDNWRRGSNDMSKKELILLRYNNLIDNIYHAIENGRNFIYRNEDEDEAIVATPLISEIFYEVGVGNISVAEGIDSVMSKSSLRYLPSDIANFSTMTITSLIPVVAEPLAEIVPLDGYTDCILFKNFVMNILDVADRYSGNIANLLNYYTKEDMEQLEASFIVSL